MIRGFKHILRVNTLRVRLTEMSLERFFFEPRREPGAALAVILAAATVLRIGITVPLLLVGCSPCISVRSPPKGL